MNSERPEKRSDALLDIEWSRNGRHRSVRVTLGGPLVLLIGVLIRASWPQLCDALAALRAFSGMH